MARLDRQTGWTPDHLDDPVPAGLPGLTPTARVAAVGAFADALDRGTREQAAAHYAGSAAGRRPGSTRSAGSRRTSWPGPWRPGPTGRSRCRSG
ncbi:hypothetical protein AB0O31_03825 [Kitasatospora cineracea]|uniref:hypothetical protein n=1 Tax=Kitasatospora cineracea TaxID=88074 RepID=UPI00341EF9C3